MKTLTILVMLLFSTLSYADKVTSAIGGIIKSIPSKGNVVKKGDPLVKYKTSGVELKIEIMKVKIKIAKEEFKDLSTLKKKKYKRTLKIIQC